MLASAAIAKYNKTATSICAIDPLHRCNAQCQYFVHRSVAVCKTSRHTHRCGELTCTLSEQRGDGAYCTITAFQVGPPTSKAYINKATHAYGRRQSNQHWAIVKKRACKTKQSTLRFQKTTALLHLVFCSPDRIAVYESAKGKHAAKVQRVSQESRQHSYESIFALHLTSYSSRRPPSKSVPHDLTVYVVKIIQLLAENHNRLQNVPKKTDQAIALGLLQLLEIGLSADGVILVHKSKFVSAFAPSLHQYGYLPGIRARQQSIAVRYIKQHLVTPTGIPLLQLPPCPV